jgi:hypothetical protein
MGTEFILVADRLQREEAPPHNFRHVALFHGANVLILNAPENGGDALAEGLPQEIISRLGGQERRYNAAPIYRGGSLRDVLAEVDERFFFSPVGFHTVVGVEEHFIEQYECTQALLLRELK